MCRPRCAGISISRRQRNRRRILDGELAAELKNAEQAKKDLAE